MPFCPPQSPRGLAWRLARGNICLDQASQTLGPERCVMWSVHLLTLGMLCCTVVICIARCSQEGAWGSVVVKALRY